MIGQIQAILPGATGKELAKPEINGRWIQPALGKPAQPVWGHVNGIRIGLSPMGGPRGLIRIYTPYLGQSEGTVFNFIAFEPIPEGENHRGFSELELSELDGVRGKRFWSSDQANSCEPLPEEFPARGIVEVRDGVETLTLYIFSEPFKNGAKVYARLRFYADRPYDIELSTFRYGNSKDLKNFIVTATMGNYARLRNLYLKNKIETSTNLWSEYKANDFAQHAIFPSTEMIRDKKGQAYFIAAPNEKEPVCADYSPDTRPNWKYEGKPATQYWYCSDPDNSLEGLVNGRFVYWASTSPIPGGIAFENFEMKEIFREGATFVFGVSPLLPQQFIREITRR